MPRKDVPGYAFTVQTTKGYVIGVVSHHLERYGTIVWISRDTFGSKPNLEDARAVSHWRYPTMFPASAAVAHGNAEKLGKIALPSQISVFPRMRAGTSDSGWWEMTLDAETGRVKKVARTYDRSLPILQGLNTEGLRQYVESEWEPAVEF